MLPPCRRKTVEKGAAPAPASTPPPKRPCAEEHWDSEEQTFWMESARSLECAICFMPFEVEIYMCTNGHAACATCCLCTNRKCSCCNEPIGDVRCRPLEDTLADMNTHCRFRKYGCGETLKYTERRIHEETCPRAPYTCPIAGCSYHGLLLYEHVVEDHADMVASRSHLQRTTVTLRRNAPFRVLLQAGSGRVYLLLNGGDVLGGRCLSLVSLSPRPEGDAEISYKIKVGFSELGELTLAATAPCVRSLEGFQAKKFLFVPDAEWGPSGSVSVSIYVG